MRGLTVWEHADAGALKETRNLPVIQEAVVHLEAVAATPQCTPHTPRETAWACDGDTQLTRKVIGGIHE